MIRTERFVIDTNTLISSVLIKNSTSFNAIGKAINNGEIVFSNETFFEFEDVLLRKKFDRYLTKEERIRIIQKTFNESILTSVTSVLQICRDIKDDKFLNLAIDSGASCIITGDNDLLILHPFQNIPILSPSDFLEYY